MKKLNSTSDFTAHRARVMLEDFRRALAAESIIAIENVLKRAVATPAPRFWVSEHRAAVVVAQILAGKDPTSGMYAEKREMYLEIFRRFSALRKMNPDESVFALVSEVVNTPAPRHYISPCRFKTVVMNEKRRRKEAQAASDATGGKGGDWK